MKKRTCSVVLASFIFASIPLVSPTGADDTPNLAQLVHEYEKNTGGRVYEVSREKRRGQVVYEFESVRDNAVFEAIVDGSNGDVLSDNKENRSVKTVVSGAIAGSSLPNSPSLGELLVMDNELKGASDITEITTRIRNGDIEFLIKRKGKGTQKLGRPK